MRVTEGNTDLGWGQTLTGELDDMLYDIFGSGFEPCRWGAAVREGGGRCESKLDLIMDCQGKNATYKCPFRERAYDP